MTSLLQKIPLRNLLNERILFDANIFMVGMGTQYLHGEYSFENRKELYLIPILENFSNILIHDEVYRELDVESKSLVDTYIQKTVTIVKEGDLYGKDPQYTTIFNNISSHELVNYERGKSKDRGEVYSLAWAAHNNIRYFCSNEIMVDLVTNELEDLKDVDIVTLDIVILLAYCHYAAKNDNSKNKGLKSMYKRYCEDVIKRHKLPTTLIQYVQESRTYLQ